MKMKEFGCNNEKKMLLIHGAGASYKMWTAQIAFIESLKSYHYGTVMTHIFSVFGEKMLRKAASVKGIMDGSYQKDYISDDMKYVLSNMTKESMQHVLLTAANYSVPQGKRSITAKTLIVYGSKEAKLCKKNTELLRQQIIDCQCIVLEGYDHGELSIGNPEKHTKMLRMWMKDGNIAKGDWDE